MKRSGKCENCGGSQKYDPEKQGLACSNCGTVTPINTMEYVKTRFLTRASMPTLNDVTGASLTCENCGASLEAGDIIDTKCPYCGSHQVNSVDDGMKYEPDSIVPFAISRRRAESIFKLWIRKRKFAPNKLKKSNLAKEMRGMYFPCWLYDYNTTTNYTGIGVKEYTDSDGDTHTTRKRISGTRRGNYNNEIEPANDMLDNYNIEMFRDYARLPQHEYDSGYVLGFLTANNTNVVYDAFERERRQKAVAIEEDIKKSLGYDRYEQFSSTTDFTEVMWSYTLLPLWICDYTFKKKKYRFLINGRTGSIIGKAPKSGWKIFFLVLGILIGVGGIGVLIYLMEMGII